MARPSSWSPASLGVASAAIYGLTAAFDLSTQFWSVRPHAVVIGAGLGSLFGLLVAGVWSLAAYPLRRLPRLSPLIWLVVLAELSVLVQFGVEAWFNLFSSENTRGSLDGRSPGAALLLISITGFAVAVGSSLLQPSARRPRGRLGEAPIGWRWAALLASVLLFIVLDTAERVWLLRPSALLTQWLRAGSLFVVVLTLTALVGWRPRRLRWIGLLTIVGLSSLVWASLPDPRLEVELLTTRSSAVPFRFLRWALDRDRDGYSPVLQGGDCDDTRRRQSPRRSEVPLNGRDDNCRFGDADGASVVPTWISVAPAAPDAPTVVLITLDGWRSDRLFLKRKGKPVARALARFAEQGRVFERAYSSGAQTDITLPGLFRGTYARRLHYRFVPYTSRYRHLMPGQRLELNSAPDLRAEMISERLPIVDDPGQTATEVLKQAGYATVAVVEDGPGVLFPPQIYGQGFDRYLLVPDSPDPARNNTQAAAQIARAELARKRTAPLFLWLHSSGVVPARMSGTQGAEWSTDRSLFELDHWLAPLLAELAERERTAVVLVGTHGVRFAGKRRIQSREVAEVAIRVPLVIRGEGFAPGRDQRLVSTVDLAGTLLGLALGAGAPGLGADGVPLQRLPAGPRQLISETWWSASSLWVRDRVVVFDGRHKVVVDRVSGRAYPVEQAPIPGQQARPDHFDQWRPLEQRAFHYLETAGYLPAVGP